MEPFLFLGMGLNAWITIALILTLFGMMIFTRIPTHFVFLFAMGFFLISDILKPEEALEGFSSTSVVLIGVLFVVVAGLTGSGVIHWMTRNVLGIPKNYSAAIVRLMVPAALLSSVLSNTTVVALFIKVVRIWSKKLSIPASKLLIPLSYAAGLGGICTLIGTPPNLIVSGMLAKDRPDLVLNIFSTTIPGLFCLIVGIATILVFRKLIPVRQSPAEALGETGEYTAEFIVPSDSPLIGKTVAETGIDKLPGGRLLQIVRFDSEPIFPVAQEEFIMGADRVIYSGQIDEILQLRKRLGLEAATSPVFSIDNDKRRKGDLVTGKVLRGVQLIGHRMVDIDFETRYNTVLIAIVRQGERITGDPREVVLEFGDSLLLECHSGHGSVFQEAVKGELAFFDSEEIPRIGKNTIISSLIMLAMILLSTFNVMSLLGSCFLAAFAMIITRCCNFEQAWKAIDWKVLMIFAGSVCMGTAIERTGIGEALANGMLQVCGTNPIVALTCICFVATFITEFISNTAAAAMFYPIAYHTAITLNANPVTFCVGLMIAASCSFATPIGSPTHMMVYGEGGYHFTDFARIGLMMNIIILIANIFIVTLMFPL